jgi:hypothetical protein
MNKSEYVWGGRIVEVKEARLRHYGHVTRRRKATQRQCLVKRSEEGIGRYYTEGKESKAETIWTCNKKNWKATQRQSIVKISEEAVGRYYTEGKESKAEMVLISNHGV